MRARLTLLLFVAVVLLASCAGNTVKDPAFGTDLAALQQKVDAFLANLETVAGTTDGDFAGHAAFYPEVREEVASLQRRAANIPGNAAILAGLAGIAENLQHLESLHRQGVSPAEVPVLRNLLGVQFNALSQSEKE